jgi:diguanylate cyclase (GGDEF)-like protein
MFISSIQPSSLNTIQKKNNVIAFQSHSRLPESQKLYGSIAARIDSLELDLDMTSDEKMISTQVKNLSVEEAKKLIQTRLSEFSKKLETLIYHDSLLGIPNRRAFDRDKIKNFLRVCAHNEELGYMAFDIDNFGGYNNAYGHQEGDKALKVFAEHVQKVLGKKGTLYRIGGEEFVALLPRLNEEEVGVLAEKIRKRVQNISVKLTKEEYLPGRFTVSIGYSSMQPVDNGTRIRELYSDSRISGNKESAKKFRDAFNNHFVSMEQAADNSLYISKLFKGRNSCTNARELEENNLFSTMLSLGRDFASIMRNTSQTVTEELVSALKRFEDKK